MQWVYMCAWNQIRMLQSLTSDFCSGNSWICLTTNHWTLFNFLLFLSFECMDIAWICWCLNLLLLKLRWISSNYEFMYQNIITVEVIERLGYLWIKEDGYESSVRIYEWKCMSIFEFYEMYELCIGGWAWNWVEMYEWNVWVCLSCMKCMKLQYASWVVIIIFEL